MSDTPDLVATLAALVDRAVAARERPTDSPWLSTKEAAQYAKCSSKVLYHAVATGKLRAARVNDRKDLRHRRDWLNSWLEASAPVEVAR
jgi:excisionase family DNA binding protein